MRSCALRILLAATISIALVIFCVFLILEILVRISFPPCHLYLSDYQRGKRWLGTNAYQVCVALNFSKQLLKLSFDVVVVVTCFVDFFIRSACSLFM